MLKTRPLRYGLRTLLVCVTLVCILLTFLPHKARQYTQRKARARQHILKLGGVLEDYGYSTNPSPGTNWLSKMLGYSEGHEKLWAVNLAGRHLTAADLKPLRGCGWIRKLDLSDTKVGNDSLQYIAQCGGLVELRLTNTRISDDGVVDLKALQKLVLLDVATTSASYDGLAQLERFLPGRNFQEQLALSRMNIAQLAISRTSRGAPQPRTELGGYLEVPAAAGLHFLRPVALTANQVEDLRRLSSARWLEAGGVALPNGLEFITDLRNLETVTFDEARTGNLRDEDMQYLAKLPKLKSLSISSSNLSDAALPHIAAIPRLQSLEISGTQFTNDGIAHFASAVGLKSLTLDGTQLTPSLLVHLRALPQLTDLRLYLWYRGSQSDRDGRPPPQVMDAAREAMKYLAEFPSLEELDARGNLIVAEALAPVTELRALQRLKVDGRYVSHKEARRLQDAMPHCHVERMNASKSPIQLPSAVEL